MLVGRRAELSRLAELLDTDRPVVVVGEAGVGKTTLLRAVAEASTRPVLMGGALSTLSWMDNLALRRALGRPVAVGDPTVVADDVERAVGAGVLLVDDLQWADRATLAAIALLAGRIGLLAGVRRDDSSADLVLDGLREAGFAEMALDPLDGADAAQLVHALRPDLPAVTVERLVRRTGGNPLLLRELAATGEPSESLRLALAARLRKLDAVGREAFGVLALAGRPVSVEGLGEAGAKSLLDADLAVLVPAGIEIRHALLGEVAVSQMSDEERRALHARIAREADDRGEAARHHALAGEPDLALAAALRAVEETERPGERASHLALAASCASGPDADALRLRAAHALEDAHDWTAMVRVLDELSSTDAQTRAGAALLRARGAWAAGDTDGLRSALDEGLALVGGTGSATEVRLRIECSRVPTFVEHDFAAGTRMSGEALELARATEVDVPRALYLHGTATYFSDPDAAEPMLRAAIAGARSAGDTNTEFLAANNTVVLHESTGSPARARELVAEYIERARAEGLGEWERAFDVAASNLDFHAGQYGAVLEHAERLLGLSLEKRARYSLIEQAGLSLVDLGRIEEALRRLETDWADAAEDELARLGMQWVRIEAALWGGRPQRARDLADAYIARSSDDGNLVFVRLSRAWACLDLDTDPGPTVDGQTMLMLHAAPPESEGITWLHRGEPAAAAIAFDRAADLWAPYHRRGELRCRWAAGEAARRAGDSPAAVARLEAVERSVEAAGMLPLLGRIHRSLRAAGRRRSAPRATGTGAISGRERAVLELVAAGLTNPEIAARLGVSRPTVASQIASASAKLGASNRRQAALLALAQDT